MVHGIGPTEAAAAAFSPATNATIDADGKTDADIDITSATTNDIDASAEDHV